MAPLELSRPDAPEWFERAIAHPRTSHSVESAGVTLHVAGWNAEDTDKPPLLFVHGFRAHGHWWDHIAPFFVERHRVMAMDFAGMGGSGHRAEATHYSRQHFADDIVAVARWLKAAAPELPLAVAGHSFGGSRMLEACAQEPGLVDHAIVLDSKFRLHDDEWLNLPSVGRPTPYPTEAQIRGRFRLLPPQDSLPYVQDHIARHSYVAVPGGYTWRIDQRIPGDLDAGAGEPVLQAIRNRVDVVRGEHSVILTAPRAARIAALLPQSRGPVVIPEAHHHLMLDQPLALVATLRSLLA
jgi:pimeloyl-ACP methyl ester carboxylesterase